MGTVKEIAFNFHNLKGFTVAERRKSLFVLLNSIRAANSNVLDRLVSSASPKTHLESLFWVELLIFFKRSVELFEVLKSGNEQRMSKIFRNPWFFRHPFEDLSADTIVNELLPNLSFVSRNRLIKCLAKYHKDESRLDNVFDALLKWYGIKTAELILPGCSLGKIREAFNLHDADMPAMGPLVIYNRNPQMFTELKEYFSDSYRDSRLVKMIKWKEPDIIGEFTWIKFGRRSTRRLIIHDRRYVITHATHLMKKLHLRTVYKRLGRKDALHFLKNIFPASTSLFSFDVVYEFLKYFPKVERFQLFSETFQNVYKMSLLDNMNCFDDLLLESIENEEELDKCIHMKVKQGRSRVAFFEYYSPKKAISLIKEDIISSKSDDAKSQLAQKLIIICIRHSDSDSFIDVLEFLLQQLNNTSGWIKRDVLNVIGSGFHLLESKTQHWNLVIKICKAFHDETQYYSLNEELRLCYLFYLWQDKQPIEEKFVELLENDYIRLGNLQFTNIFKSKEFTEVLLNITVKTMPGIWEEENLLRVKDLDYLCWILSWNKGNPKSKISVLDYPRLATSVIEYIRNKIENGAYNYGINIFFKEFVCTKSGNHLTNTLTDIYFQSGIERYMSTHIVLWMLKNDPQVLSKYTDTFIVACCSRSEDKQKRILWEYVKKLSHYQFCEKATKYCVEHYAKSFKTKSLLKVLAFLMCPEDFVSVVTKHVPVTGGTDIGDEESKENFRINSTIATCFKYTQSVVVVPALMKFCVGDYLGYALESLYYLAYHSPENKLNPSLEKLLTETVSVRKHALFVTSQVGTIRHTST